jgi:hypothetical protein
MWYVQKMKRGVMYRHDTDCTYVPVCIYHFIGCHELIQVGKNQDTTLEPAHERLTDPNLP